MQGNPYLRANNVKKYANTSVGTATPQQLVLMLYDGSIRFLNTSKAMLSAKNFTLFGENLLKAQRIFTELKAHLNHDLGGEIAVNLERLYDFIDYKLTHASIKKDSGLIDEAMRVIVELRGAWVGICDNPKAVEDEVARLRLQATG